MTMQGDNAYLGKRESKRVGLGGKKIMDPNWNPPGGDQGAGKRGDKTERNPNPQLPQLPVASTDKQKVQRSVLAAGLPPARGTGEGAHGNMDRTKDSDGQRSVGIHGDYDQ